MPTFRFRDVEREDALHMLRTELWILSGTLKGCPVSTTRQQPQKLISTVKRALRDGLDAPFGTDDPTSFKQLLDWIGQDVDVLMENTPGRRGRSKRAARSDPVPDPVTVENTMDALDTHIQQYLTRMTIVSDYLRRHMPTFALVVCERDGNLVVMYRDPFNEEGEEYAFFDMDYKVEDMYRLGHMGFTPFGNFISLGTHDTMGGLVGMYHTFAGGGDAERALQVSRNETVSVAESTLQEVAARSGIQIRNTPSRRTHTSKPSTGRPPLTVFPAGARMYATDDNGDTVLTDDVAVNMPYRNSGKAVRLHWVCPYPWSDAGI